MAAVPQAGRLLHCLPSVIAVVHAAGTAFVTMEDAIINEPFKHALVDFAIEHPDGRLAILEIVGFWTPEYLESKLTKIRQRGRQFRVGCVRTTALCK